MYPGQLLRKSFNIHFFPITHFSWLSFQNHKECDDELSVKICLILVLLQQLVPWILSLHEHERERALNTCLMITDFYLENMTLGIGVSLEQTCNHAEVIMMWHQPARGCRFPPRLCSVSSNHTADCHCTRGVLMSTA